MFESFIEIVNKELQKTPKLVPLAKALDEDLKRGCLAQNLASFSKVVRNLHFHGLDPIIEKYFEEIQTLLPRALDRVFYHSDPNLNQKLAQELVEYVSQRCIQDKVFELDLLKFIFLQIIKVRYRDRKRRKPRLM